MLSSDFLHRIKHKTIGDNPSHEKHHGILWDVIEYQAKQLYRSLMKLIEPTCQTFLADISLIGKECEARHNMVRIGNEKISKLPEDLYSDARTNTGHRSLTVVDFALRRLFPRLL